jgi:hypothetical protein
MSRAGSVVRVAVKKDIRLVADALRYSDPMSRPSLEIYGNDIEDGIARLGQAVSEKVSALCATLLRQIENRNNRAKQMK